MSAQVTTQKASTGKGGKLRSVSIEIAETGFIGSCSYEGKPSKDGYPMYEPDKKYALADRAAVHTFLDKFLDLGPDQPKTTKPGMGKAPGFGGLIGKQK